MSKTYQIATLQDVVDKVPSDRIIDCLKELGVLLFTAKTTIELQHGVARNLAKADGRDIEPLVEGQRIIQLPPFIEWVDDGKGDVVAHIQKPGGETLFTVQSKMK